MIPLDIASVRAVAFTAPIACAAVCLILAALDKELRLRRLIWPTYTSYLLLWLGMVAWSVFPNAYIRFMPLFIIPLAFGSVLQYRLICQITAPQEKTFSRLHWIVPSLVTAIGWTVMLALPFEPKWEMVYGRSRFSILDILFIICLISKLSYSVYSLHCIRSIQREEAKPDSLPINTLIIGLIGGAVLQGIPIYGLLLSVDFFERIPGGWWWIAPAASFYLYCRLFFLLVQKRHEVAAPEEPEEPTEPTEKAEKTEAEVATYNEMELNRARVDDYMKLKKPFLDPEFRLDRMARELATNRSYLSAFINREYGMNFNRFVNAYRLEEYKRLLAEASLKKKHTTSLQLAQHAGFGNYRSFIRAKKLP
jgi:AraC-like DNA-binding protein